MDCSMPCFPVLHYLLECAQTHVLWISDAIQPSHPWSLPSPPTFNLSQHQGFSSESALGIRWPNIGASTSASVLALYIHGWFPLGLSGLISLQSKGLSRVFSSTIVHFQYSLFFSVDFSFHWLPSSFCLSSSFHICFCVCLVTMNFSSYFSFFPFNLKKICIMPHFCQIFLLITEFLSASKILYHCVLARILLDKNSVIIHIFVWKNMFSPS